MDVPLLSCWDRRGCPWPCSKPPCIAWQCSALLNRLDSLSQQEWISQQEASSQLTVSPHTLSTLDPTFCNAAWLFFCSDNFKALQHNTCSELGPRFPPCVHLLCKLQAGRNCKMAEPTGSLPAGPCTSPFKTIVLAGCKHNSDVCALKKSQKRSLSAVDVRWVFWLLIGSCVDCYHFLQEASRASIERMQLPCSYKTGRQLPRSLQEAGMLRQPPEQLWQRL